MEKVKGVNQRGTATKDRVEPASEPDGRTALIEDVLAMRPRVMAVLRVMEKLQRHPLLDEARNQLALAEYHLNRTLLELDVPEDERKFSPTAVERGRIKLVEVRHSHEKFGQVARHADSLRQMVREIMIQLHLSAEMAWIYGELSNTYDCCGRAAFWIEQAAAFYRQKSVGG